MTDRLTKRDAMELLDINAVEAGALLKSMTEANELVRISRGQTTRDARNDPNLELPPYSQEEKVESFAADNRAFSNVDVQELLHVSASGVNVLLYKMVKKGTLKRCARGLYRINR